MSTGGSIQEISIRGRNFAVAADADVTRKLGGFEATLEANGDGTARKIMTRVTWAVTGLTVDVNQIRGDHEFLQDICNGTVADEDGFVAVTVTHADGTTWQGRGTITEALEYNSMNTTAAVGLGGPGTLQRQ